MATIDEVLAAMPEAAAEAAYEYLTIDPATRRIIVPEAEEIFGVESDTQAARKYFQCPRYVGDNVDLAACFLRVNYRNANGEVDAYLVQDAAVSGDLIVFSWELSRKVTQYKGQIQFVVCACYPHTGGSMATEWNTTVAVGTVLEGLEPDSSSVEAETSDVITQLRAETAAQTDAVEACGAAQVKAVAAAGTTQVNTVKTTGAQTEAAALAAIEAKGEAVRASIPEDYTTLANTVDRLTHDRAAAIVCGAEGETVQVTDASADPLQGLRLFGKTEQVKTTGAQLLPIVEDATKTDRGLTQVVTGGVCTVRGIANSTAAFNLTLYGSYYNTEPVFTLQPGTYTVKDCMIVSSDGSAQKKYENTTFTLTEALGVTWVATRSYQPGEVVAETTHPMLNAGPEALPWEPYSGGVASPSPAWAQELQILPAPVVSVYGENIFDVSKMEVHANKALDVADDGATITATGGGDKPYTSSILQLNVDALRGNTLIMAADSIANTNTAANGGVQLNVHRGDRRDYEAISAASLTRSLYIGADVTDLYITIYTNNTADALGADNVVTVKGLRLNLNQQAAWSKCAALQTLAVITPDGLPGIPVESGGNYTDAAGQQWIADEVDLARGVYVKRVKQIELKNVTTWRTWGVGYISDEYTGFYVYDNSLGTVSEKCLCTFLKYNLYAFGGMVPGVKTSSSGEQYYTVSVPNSILADTSTGEAAIASLQAWLQDRDEKLLVTIKPVETPLATEELQAFRALHSNKLTTTVLNDAGAWMAVEYAADPKLYIDRKIAELVAANNN